MIAVTAQRLAQSGIATLTLDLIGTGDSEGDFRDAIWDDWISNVASAFDWASAAAVPVTGVIAIRLGAALANSAFSQVPGMRVAKTVLWNPVFDGARHVSQFLRLKTAAGYGSGNVPATNVRKALADSGELEVAGYLLSDALARQIELLSPNSEISQTLGDLTWIEVVRDVDSPMPAKSAAMIERHAAVGNHIVGAMVAGQPFHATVEITEIDELVERSVRVFAEGRTGRHHAV
jgi:exosortase A-associated hydrolase 2